jgi:uncharacterized protein
MHRPFHIDIRSLPESGKDITGQESPAFFGLDANDPIQVLSPSNMSCTCRKTARISSSQAAWRPLFSLECGAAWSVSSTASIFPTTRPSWRLQKDGTINLTDTIREDTLVALPSYPRCEDGNVRPRQCPAEGRFEPVLETAEEEPQSAGPGVWEALNN